MSENGRILDLDAVKSIPVRIGGRDFQLTQQRRAVLEKVVQQIFRYDDQKEKPDLEKSESGEFLKFAFDAWEQSIPVIALVLGYEEGNPQTPEVIQHLQENLSFPGATQLFQEWWKLNQLDRFFGRAGNPLIPEKIFSEVVDKTESEVVLN